MSTKSAFLKEMGVTEWTSRDAFAEPVKPIAASEMAASRPDSPPIDNLSATTQVHVESKERSHAGTWWFFGSPPQGEAKLLFQNIIRVLGLTPQEWSWKNPAEQLNPEQLPRDGSPMVAIAFGGAAAQKLSGEREGLSELRETVLAINADGAEDLPLIATFELNQMIASPKNKALFWQDLLLAKSVLQNT